MAFKIIRNFSGNINFEQGQVREFTGAESVKYASMIEQIKGDSGSFLDGVEDKQHKKGRKK